MPPNAVESGIRGIRTHFVRETTAGVTPTDPSWLRFSDTVRRMAANYNSNIYQQRPVGDIDLSKFLLGSEDHSIELMYELQRWIDTDAANDGLERTAGNDLKNTHSFQERQELTTGGALSAGRRIYTIGKGGRVGRVSLAGDPNTGEPVKVTLGYVFEEIRSYELARLSGSNTVDVESSDAADTTQSVTIEDDGAGTSETLALNGTTPVNGVTSFATIDSISLDAETKGDVIVKVGGTEIMRILGKDSQGGYEGDLGIPPLGSGSFETALGTAYERVIGSTIQRAGADFETGGTLRTFEVVVENNVEQHARTASRVKKIVEGVRDITAIASIFSEVGSHESFVEHLKATESDIVWTLLGGTLTLSNSALTSPGGRVYESGVATMQRNNTFTARGLSIS